MTIYPIISKLYPSLLFSIEQNNQGPNATGSKTYVLRYESLEEILCYLAMNFDLGLDAGAKVKIITT